MKVLYIHMIGAFGGASRSLIEAIGAFPAGAVEPHFVTARGSVEPFFARFGPVETARGISQFDNTRYSHYRGLRWLVILREIAYLPATIMALRRAHARWGAFDLIHVNEFTGIFPWWLARRWFKAPVIVHVRSVARNDSNSWRTRFVNWMLGHQAQGVVAIDHTVRASLPPDMPVTVIHNAFTPHRVPEDAPPLTVPQGLHAGWFRVGFVGNLLKVKGIQDLVTAAGLVRDRGLNVEFIIVGDDAAPSRGCRARLLRHMGLGQNVKADVMAEIKRLDLTERFHLLGFTQRISEAYGLMDVLCFPSHFDAPGRPVFEAAFAAKPAIVCLSAPKPDTLVDGTTGLAIPAKNPEAIADAIALLCRTPELAQRMGAEAAEMASQTFDPISNAAELLALYRRVTRITSE